MIDTLLYQQELQILNNYIYSRQDHFFHTSLVEFYKISLLLFIIIDSPLVDRPWSTNLHLIRILNSLLQFIHILPIRTRILLLDPLDLLLTQLKSIHSIHELVITYLLVKRHVVNE